MLARTAVLIVVTVFVVAFAALTIDSVIRQGFGLASALSIGVLALFVVGGIGALRQPPRE